MKETTLGDLIERTPYLDSDLRKMIGQKITLGDKIITVSKSTKASFHINGNEVIFSELGDPEHEARLPI